MQRAFKWIKWLTLLCQSLNALYWYDFKSEGMGKDDTYRRDDLVLEADRMLVVGLGMKGRWRHDWEDKSRVNISLGYDGVCHVIFWKWFSTPHLCAREFLSYQSLGAKFSDFPNARSLGFFLVSRGFGERTYGCTFLMAPKHAERRYLGLGRPLFPVSKRGRGFGSRWVSGDKLWWFKFMPKSQPISLKNISLWPFARKFKGSQEIYGKKLNSYLLKTYTGKWSIG